jgi:hypothetical protein
MEDTHPRMAPRRLRHYVGRCAFLRGRRLLLPVRRKRKALAIQRLGL